MTGVTGRCTNCGRYSAECKGYGPGYLACPRCVGVHRWAIRGRTCSICKRDDLRTVIYWSKPVCAFCLPDWDLLYLFPTEAAEHPVTQEPNLWLLGMVMSGFVLLLLFWLVVAYG